MSSEAHRSSSFPVRLLLEMFFSFSKKKKTDEETAHNIKSRPPRKCNYLYCLASALDSKFMDRRNFEYNKNNILQWRNGGGENRKQNISLNVLQALACTFKPHIIGLS